MPNPSAGASERVRAALERGQMRPLLDVRALLDERDRLAAELGQLRADRDFDRDAALRDAAALREQVTVLDVCGGALRTLVHVLILSNEDLDTLYGRTITLEEATREAKAVVAAWETNRARARAERGELTTEET